MQPDAAMRATPLQTLLEERLQSARGLGWEMPLNPPVQKGGVAAWFDAVRLAAYRILRFAR
ncbi:MAG: hypothetical protein HZB71_07450 [Betaproteobacteria bacterium]|nr:hypothetical protein [Betaproteobacteria bacterium]